MADRPRSLTAAQMREADRRCIEELGVPGAVLMNTAGRAVFAEVKAGPLGIVCGRGNNGGDGFVVAYLARAADMNVRVVLAGERSRVQGDPLIFMRAFERLGGTILEAADELAAAKAVAALSDCATLVDALLGTGIQGEVRGPVRAAIDAWPDVYTVAVDIPSGLDTDTGEPCGCCVRADVTVTFQFPKRGFDNPASHAYTGRIIVADIGIPAVCADDAAWAHLREHERNG